MAERVAIDRVLRAPHLPDRVRGARARPPRSRRARAARTGRGSACDRRAPPAATPRAARAGAPARASGWPSRRRPSSPDRPGTRSRSRCRRGTSPPRPRCSATTRSTTAPSSPASETCRSPRRSTMAAIGSPVWNASSSARFAPAPEIVPSATRRDEVGDVLRAHRGRRPVGVGLVAQAGQVLRDPVGRRGRLRAERHRLLEQDRRRRGRPRAHAPPRASARARPRTGRAERAGARGKDARISSIHASSGSSAGMSGSGK